MDRMNRKAFSFFKRLPYKFNHLMEFIKEPITPHGMYSGCSTYNLVKWFLQRGWRGYSDWDVSETNSYLTTVMARMVRQYSKNACGCPYPFYEDDYVGPTWNEKCAEIALKLEAGALWLNAEIANHEDEVHAKADWEEGMKMLIEYLPGMWI